MQACQAVNIQVDASSSEKAQFVIAYTSFGRASRVGD